MRPLLLIIVSLFILISVRSQTAVPKLSIRGTVIDSVSGKGLGYVTVAVEDIKTNTPVKSVLSKEDGNFDVAVPATKEYQLVLAFTGYVSRTIPISSTEKTVNVGKIVLSPSGKQLNEVTVTAQRPVLKRQIDGISYDVGADPESPALNALDIMRKVPLLTVDASDNIKLKGSGNYKILVNGKESALVAKNPADVLRSMPATNIERIEVITTPPAKYDAEGLAGIINIITKRKIDQGYNIGINSRYNTVWGPGFNLNGTFKQGKLGFSGYAGFNIRRTQTAAFGNTQTFFADESVISQNGNNSFNGNGRYTELELSYEFDSLNLLTGSLEYFLGKNNQNSYQLSNSLDKFNAIDQKYVLTNSGNNSYQGLDAALNYQLGFKKDKNRLLTFSYKFSYSPNKQFNTNSFSEMVNYDQSPYQQYNKAGDREHTLQVDYVLPFKKFTLEAGGKGIIRDNFSNFTTSIYNDTTGDYELNTSLSNNFKYKQDIFSIYNSYQVKWEKWTAKGGLRLEHTFVDANFISAGSNIDKGYNNFIPSLSVQRNFKSSSITLGYTDRISRPGIYQLNPFVDQTNPKFINTGNPNLKPELNHTFELNYSSFQKTSVNLGLSYAFSTNSIQNVSSLEINPNGDTVTLTTFQNLGSNSRLGLNINTSFSIIKDLTVSLNGQVAHVWLKGTFENAFYRNQGFTGNAFLNAGYKFGKGFRFGLDAGFFSGDVFLQGTSRPFLFSSYVLSRTFLNKKMTISLVANNPYSSHFNSTSHTTTAQYYQTSFNANPYRNFAVRFNFKIGKLTSEIKRNQRGINNDDKKDGKSSGNAQ